MQKLMKERLRELKVRQRRRRQMGIIAAFFGVLVIGGVVWGMTRTGVAMTGDATCGIEEHKHSDKCYENVLVCDEKESEGHKHDDGCYKTEEVLVCDKEETEANPEEGIEGHTHDKGCYEEKKELVCKEEESKGHTHTDKCYKKELVCGKEEHTHEEDCYIDRSADVEKKSDWDKQYKSTKWKDAWGVDLVTAAEKQVGYKESTKNYKKVNGDQKGYTRYGEFSGEPYADWDAAFVNFCIHYAGISKSDVFPNTTDTNKWYNKFSKVNGSFLTAPEGYEPEKGDIVFFEKKKGETDFTVGIVSSSDKDKKEIKVIEGNVDNEVKEEKYGTGDSQIFAYIKVTELEQAFKGMQPDDAENKEEEPAEMEEPAESEETEGDETEESSPAFDSEYEGDGVIIRVKADAGVVPEGAELSVMPIEKKKITSDMSAEEKEEAEKVNEQYDMTNEKLNEESEKNEQELQGFLAYDISFMLDGQEIEPNGEVKVTMDFKEAVVPEGVSENAQVAVNHLKENGNGGVKVENLTEASTTNITTAEKDAAVEKIELVSDSFSIFSISWSFDGDFWPRGSMNVYHVDENGNVLLEGSQQYPTNKIMQSGQKEWLKDQLEWERIVGKDGNAYEPYKIEVGEEGANNGFIEVEQIEIQEYNLVFYTNGEKVKTYSNEDMLSSSKCLRVVYRPYEAAEIEIDNNIKTTGNLDAKLTGSVLQSYEEAIEKNKDEDKNNDVEIKYVWYKKVNNGEFEVVENVKYDNDMSKITGEYGSSLNVALDDGVLSDDKQSIKYKVELYIGETLVGTSSPESMSYYGELRNGSFEEPRVTSEGNIMYHYFEENRVEGWKTTAVEGNGVRRIEIARVVDGKIDNYYGEPAGYFSVPDGDQFAELNAVTQGSLYQDVLAVKGVQLNYSFSHCARPNVQDNHMSLVIVPTFVAENGVPGGNGEIDTQEEVKYLMAHRNDKNEEGELLYPGVYVQNYTTNSSSWVEHSGIYIPQYNLNRFFFVSNATIPSMGNFIDDVWFSQRLPEPKKDTFNFRIVKTIKGLEEIDKIEGSAEKIKALKEKIGALTFNISVENLVKRPLEEHIPEKLNALDMEWTDNGDGSYTGVRNYYDIPIGGEVYTISVQEENADIDPYGLTTTVTRISSGKQETPVSGQSGEVVVKKDAQERLIFENVYGEKDNSIWKVVKCSSSDKTKLLEGATFSLTDQETRLKRILTGQTNANGEIKWSGDLSDLNGQYILKETRAPEGYSCSEKEWILTFNNGKLDAAALEEQIAGDEDFIVLNSENNVHEISIYNVRLYSLPSTGGKGIYLYMFSGILLMAGGLLMTYKNRRRGVLRS